MRGQLLRRASRSKRKMGQDKLQELLEIQIRRNPLPRMGFRHINRQSNGILADSVDNTGNPCRRWLADKFCQFEEPATSCWLTPNV
jgi:hypothetical protein